MVSPQNPFHDILMFAFLLLVMFLPSPFIKNNNSICVHGADVVLAF